ncbi:PREDICTED: translation initiation factor IF-2-like [Chinchilla lanigera]|uniref:translation initiation factor IF-2-like n=1 Tax=Chinchilla lanigera TaxID=34839 RepID=UPI000698A220|nr:PREDICTED: translation initiation factor IF-2-like [Chinchilla lanigera]
MEQLPGLASPGVTTRSPPFPGACAHGPETQQDPKPALAPQRPKEKSRLWVNRALNSSLTLTANPGAGTLRLLHNQATGPLRQGSGPRSQILSAPPPLSRHQESIRYGGEGPRAAGAPRGRSRARPRAEGARLAAPHSHASGFLLLPPRAAAGATLPRGLHCFSSAAGEVWGQKAWGRRSSAARSRRAKCAGPGCVATPPPRAPSTAGTHPGAGCGAGSSRGTAGASSARAAEPAPPRSGRSAGCRTRAGEAQGGGRKETSSRCFRPRLRGRIRDGAQPGRSTGGRFFEKRHLGPGFSTSGLMRIAQGVFEPSHAQAVCPTEELRIWKGRSPVQGQTLPLDLNPDWMAREAEPATAICTSSSSR